MKETVRTRAGIQLYERLVRKHLVDQLQKSQLGFEATQDQLADTLEMYREKVDGLDERLATIVHQLRIGFRLREDE